jgi:hypothetical protein
VDLHRPDLAQREGLGRQRQKSGLLMLEEQPQGRLMRRAVITASGGLVDPDRKPLVGDPDVRKVLARHEVALQIVNPIFDLALVAGRMGLGGADDEAVVLRHPAVGFTQDRVMNQSLGHGRLQVVRHDPPGNPAPSREGPPVQSDPGGNLLVEDQLSILMTAVAQGRNKRIGGAQAIRGRVIQLPHRAEVHLGLLARRGVHPHHHPWLDWSKTVDIAADGGIAPVEAVVVPQALKDGHHLHLLIEELLDDLGVGFDRRGGPRRLRRIPQSRRNRTVLRHGRARLQEAPLLGQFMVTVHGNPRNPQVPGDTPLALAGAQAVN